MTRVSKCARPMTRLRARRVRLRGRTERARRHMRRRRPRRGAGLRSSHGRWGERGHQVCAEPSAALGSEGSSRTTGMLNAWGRGEVRCGVMAWEVIVSFPSMWWRQRALSHPASAVFRRLAGVLRCGLRAFGWGHPYRARHAGTPEGRFLEPLLDVLVCARAASPRDASRPREVVRQVDSPGEVRERPLAVVELGEALQKTALVGVDCLIGRKRRTALVEGCGLRPQLAAPRSASTNALQARCSSGLFRRSIPAAS